MSAPSFFTCFSSLSSVLPVTSYSPRRYTPDGTKRASVEQLGGREKRGNERERINKSFRPSLPFHTMHLEPLVFECDEALAGVSSGIIMIDTSWTALQLCGEEEEEEVEDAIFRFR